MQVSRRKRITNDYYFGGLSNCSTGALPQICKDTLVISFVRLGRDNIKLQVA